MQRVIGVIIIVILVVIVVSFALGGCLSSKTTHGQEPELGCGQSASRWLGNGTADTVTLDCAR